VTHLGRTVTVRERGVSRGALASRPGHSLFNVQRHQSNVFGVAPKLWTLDVRLWASLGPRSRRRSSKPNLQELGGTARGSTPPRASKIRNGCVAQAELEQASHKREVGGSTPPTVTKSYWAGDVTDSIEVLQTSCEGLNPSQSTKLRRSSIG
jgi:hypothetical protein